jgi:hypothetical protein
MKLRKTEECRAVRASMAEGGRGSAEEAHLFSCADCRREARFSAAWAAWKSSEDVRASEGSSASPVDERFVRGVLSRVRADRASRSRVRVRLAAAAALLFFFLAGAAQRVFSSTSAGIEDSYAQLETPSPDLEAELPE